NGVPIVAVGQRQNEGHETVYKGQNAARDEICQPVRSKRKQSTRQNHGDGYFHQDRRTQQSPLREVWGCVRRANKMRTGQSHPSISSSITRRARIETTAPLCHACQPLGQWQDLSCAPWRISRRCSSGVPAIVVDLLLPIT